MAIEIQAPNIVPAEHRNKFSIFLGGAIDMGSAEDWQKKLIADLNHLDILILNPRRDDFRVWEEQSKDNPYFKEQVMWELVQQQLADIRVYYLPAGSQCRITLLEIGLFCRDKEHVIFCEKGFDRKGNIDVVCETFGLCRATDYDDLLAFITEEALK